MLTRRQRERGLDRRYAEVKTVRKDPCDGRRRNGHEKGGRIPLRATMGKMGEKKILVGGGAHTNSMWKCGAVLIAAKGGRGKEGRVAARIRKGKSELGRACGGV